MSNATSDREELLAILKTKSVFHGDFVLSSGARSSHYFDCKVTTLDPRAAWLVGRLMLEGIRQHEQAHHVRVEAVGGLTMGADPIAFSIGMVSYFTNPMAAVDVFIVRKTPKAHGQSKMIEGSSVEGRAIVVIDDVVTRGDSTLTAIDAIHRAGGKVVLAAVLVDREEGGRAKIEARGVPVFSLFRKRDILDEECGTVRTNDGGTSTIAARG